MSVSNEKWERVEGTTEAYFYRGKHIESKSWDSSFPPLQTYEYYGDNTVCTAQGSSANIILTHKIRVPELIHITDSVGAIGILRECALKPGKKRLPGLEELNDKIVWFGIPINEEQKNYVLNSCAAAVCESIDAARVDITTLRTNLKEVFASSAAFDPSSRYGNYKFKFPIKELMQMYQDQCCEGKKPDRIILGTSCYRQEIMHIIGICPPDTIGKDKCPRLGEGDSSVIKEDTAGNFTWMPCSTGDKRKTIRRNGDVIQSGNKYRRWDHVCFAMFVPQTNITLEHHLMVMRDNVTFCSGNKIALRKNDLNLNQAIRRLVDSAEAETDNGSKSRLLIAAINMVSNYNGSLDEFIIGTLNVIVDSITIFPVKSTDIQPAIEKIRELTERKDLPVGLSPILQRRDDNKHTEFDSEAEKISDMLSTTALEEGLSNVTGNNQMPSSTTK